MSDQAVPSVLGRLQALLASRYLGDTLPPDYVNLVSNGGFEGDVIGQPVAGWVRTIGSAAVMNASSQTFLGSTGNQSSTLGTGTAETWQFKAADFSPVEANTNYTARCAFRQTINGNYWRFNIEWYDEDYALISSSLGGAVADIGNNHAGRYTMSASSPANAAWAKLVIDHPPGAIWNGHIDSIMFAPTAQLTDNFAAHALGPDLLPNILQHLRLGETVGSTFADSSGKGRTATGVGGAVGGDPSLVTGDANKAVNLDGASGSRIDAGFNPFPQGGTGVLTFYGIAWPNNYGALFGDASNVLYFAQTAAGTFEFNPNRFGGGGGTVTWTGVPDTDHYRFTWHLIVEWLTGSTGTAELFINGRTQGVRNFSTYAAGAGNLYWGNMGTTGLVTPFNGTIDEVGVYGGRKTAAQVLDFATAVAGVFYHGGNDSGWYWTSTPNNSPSAGPRYAPSSDQILDAILGGIADGAERLGLVAFGDDTIPAGRALTDPSVAPDWALAHASLYTSGGLLPGRLPTETDAAYEARARDAAVYPLGIKAGTDEAIRRTVAPLLTGTKSVFISVGSDPYHLSVRTLPSETPDQTAVINAINGSYVSGGLRGALRAELALEYAASTSPQFSEATRTFATVAAGATSTTVTRTDVT